jgi:hypothetical protein
MGFYYNYFVAPEPEALACIDEGPEQIDVPQTGELAGVDPVIILGELIDLVRGQPLVDGIDVDEDFGKKADDFQQPMPDNRWLARIDDAWVAALAGITDDQLAALASAWSTSKYWIGSRTSEQDVAELAGIVRDLRGLAQVVRSDGERRMFCWVEF